MGQMSGRATQEHRCPVDRAHANASTLLPDRYDLSSSLLYFSLFSRDSTLLFAAGCMPKYRSDLYDVRNRCTTTVYAMQIPCSHFMH